MPVINLPSRYTAGPVRHDLLQVLSAMCFPKSPEKESKLSYGLAVEEVLASGDSVPNDIARDLPGHVPPVTAMAKDLTRARLHGMVTGFMLRWSVSRWNAGLIEEASKARAANVVHEWLQKSPDRRPAKSSAVESWFDEYRSVAHLWAAWQIIDDAGLNATTPEGFSRLLKKASQRSLEDDSLI